MVQITWKGGCPAGYFCFVSFLSVFVAQFWIELLALLDLCLCCSYRALYCRAPNVLCSDFYFISFENVDCVSLCNVITMLAHQFVLFGLSFWRDWLPALSCAPCIFFLPFCALPDAPQPVFSSSYFQHQARSKLPIFVMLDSCLFSAWTPKLQVPDADYTWSFVELDSVTSRALVLSALNFPIICGSKRSDHPLPDWRLCQLRGLRTTGSMWLDLKGNCAIVKHLPSASIAKALYHDTRDCSVLWLVACTHALLPLRPFCYSAQSSHSSVERLRLSVFLLLLFLGGTLTVRTQHFGGYHCGP